MDKKALLRNSLDRIMIDRIGRIREIVAQHPMPEVTTKSDGSPVTKLDLALSNFIEEMMEEHFKGVTFYSEENFSEWKFPLLSLDPLDGTREYIEGRDEWALSIGLFQDQSFEGEGWVYNPLRDEVFNLNVPAFVLENKSCYRGEVSRSEYNKGLFERVTGEGRFIVDPVGSIAYKLARLAYQNSDFVVSLRPKNIWDIAGGTLLCKQAGLKFYSQGKEVTEVKPLYEAPLIWCPEELSSSLLKIYC